MYSSLSQLAVPVVAAKLYHGRDFVSPAASLRDSKTSLSQSTLGLALERGFGSQTTLSGSEYRPAMEELEEAINLSNMATPKMGKRLHIPVVRIHDAQVRKG